MIISKKHKFVYISQQRTGSHTMFRVLKKHYCGFHYKGNGYHGRKVPKEYRNFYTFTTCRNPYSRAVSIWRVTVDGVTPGSYGAKFKIYNKVKNEKFKNFAKWLSEMNPLDHHGMIMPQHLWFKPIHRLDAIFHIEDIEQEILKTPFWDSSISARVGYAKNRTDMGKPHWSTYYNPKIIKLIQKWAGSDFDMLGYSKEI